MKKKQQPLILVTGVTGYIGGRLVPLLLERGYRVRCMVRDPRRLKGASWQSGVEIVAGDVFDPESLTAALEGVFAAYYLIHSMAGGSDYHQRDLTAAANFSNAAKAVGCERIIFLGGLAEPTSSLSEHLRSRQQTGDSLRSSGVPVTEFRAGVIVGSGSLSFEMIRYLTERVPVMVCPRWVYTRTQPIGIEDVLNYLASALAVPESSGRIIEIGGAKVVTYGQMMTIYAEVRGLRRWMVPVPVLTPRLSSYWVNLVTPIPSSIAQPLIEGLRNESVVHDPIARQLFTQVEPVEYRTAVTLALGKLDAANPAFSTDKRAKSADLPRVEITTREGMIIEERESLVAASAADLYRTFTGLGGKRGWLYLDWVWSLRGLVDRMFGGVGMRRGRRDADELAAGETLDFWRVEAVEAGRLLRLRAEMRLPGRVWLQFEASPTSEGGSRLRQTTLYAPRGLPGWLYWYALYPMHRVVFSGLQKAIAKRAESKHD